MFSNVISNIKNGIAARPPGRNNDDQWPSAERRAHYELEKRLAARLLHSSRDERCRLYTSVYDELFRKVPNHPMMSHKLDPQDRLITVAKRMHLLRRFLRQDTVFVEVGAGDCRLSFAVAAETKQCFAIEVSDEISRVTSAPENFKLVLSNGTDIPINAASADVVFSDQLMEHLHPEDALEQLRGIHRVLRPGGAYICITPNRLNGPHDVSFGFDPVATGLHLKEYTNKELLRLLHDTGFTKVRALVAGGGVINIEMPAVIVIVLEAVLQSLPRAIAYPLARAVLIKFLLGIRLIAIK